ncbi:hypothetical protein A2U01_0054327, partial [Trifolium medium]|nr:hypothetical protein [Trifolium medium]
MLCSVQCLFLYGSGAAAVTGSVLTVVVVAGQGCSFLGVWPWYWRFFRPTEVGKVFSTLSPRSGSLT